MSLRNFRGTPAFLLLGLLQGCAGGKQSVPAPAAQGIQATQSRSEDQRRQDAVDETARLTLAAGHDYANIPSKNDALRPPARSGSADGSTANAPTPTGTGGIALSAVPLNSRDPDVLTDMGILALQKGDLAAAEKSLRAALEIDPTHRRALLHLAQTLSRQGRQEESARLFGSVQPIAAQSPGTAARQAPPVPPQPPTAVNDPGLPLRCDLADAMIPPQPHVERGQFASLPPSTTEVVDPALPARPSTPKAPLVFDLPPSRSAVRPKTLVPPHTPMTPAEDEGAPASLPTPPPEPSAPPSVPPVAEKTHDLVNPPAPTVPPVAETTHEPVSPPAPAVPPVAAPTHDPVPPPPALTVPPVTKSATTVLDQVGEILAAPPSLRPDVHVPLAKLRAPEEMPEPPVAVAPPVVTVAPPVVEAEEKPGIVPAPSTVVVSIPDARVLPPTMPTPVAPEPPPAVPTPAAVPAQVAPVPQEPKPPSAPVQPPPVNLPTTMVPAPAAVPIPIVTTEPPNPITVVTGPDLPPAPAEASRLVPVTSPTLIAVPTTVPATSVAVSGPVLPPAPVAMPVVQAVFNTAPVTAPIVQTRATEVVSENPAPAPVVVPQRRVIITDVKAE